MVKSEAKEEQSTPFLQLWSLSHPPHLMMGHIFLISSSITNVAVGPGQRDSGSAAVALLGPGGRGGASGQACCTSGAAGDSPLPLPGSSGWARCTLTSWWQQQARLGPLPGPTIMQFCY